MFDIGFWELFLIFMLLRYFFELKDSIQSETSSTTEEVNKIINDQKNHIDNLEKEIDKAKEDK